MQKVMCENCKLEVPVMLYFYNARIVSHESSLFNSDFYEAEVQGRSTCPFCGAEVHKTFRRIINKEDITDLAGGRGEE